MKPNSSLWKLYLWIGVLLFASCSIGWAAETLEERVERLEKTFSVSENTFKCYWKNDSRCETLGKEILIRFGGRIQFDVNFPHFSDEVESAFGDPEDRFFFRRARLFIRGTLYEAFDFKAEYDFAGDTVAFTDVYIRANDLPYVGNIYAGRFKGPFGLEELTSDNFITLQERSLTDAFVPGRTLGFMFENTLFDERATWGISITRPEGDETSASTDDLDITLRLTGVPWFQDDGRQLLHLGFGYIWRNRHHAESIRFRTRPEAIIHTTRDFDDEELDVRFVDTGELPVDEAHTIGFEAAFVHGPFSVQGEVMGAMPRGLSGDPTEDDVDDMRFWGYYIMLSYFLTGEHRPYDASSAVFERPDVKRPFFRQGGLGAWELAFRVSGIDLDDVDKIDDTNDRGGRELNLTLGVNWYPNPNTRVTLNYVTGWVDDRTITLSNDADETLVADLDNDSFGVFMMRFQVDF
jgi:phosphate-selective porin OprO and OprP